MQVVILFALFAASQASVLFGAPALINTGGSTQYRAQDNIGNYNFGYNEGHLSGGTFRKEAGDAAGNKVGSYGLRDADGRVRIVNYVADAAGFRADIKTNEPGVDPVQDPAATTVNKALISAPAPIISSYAAPAYAPYAAPALTHYATAPAFAYAAPAHVGHYGLYNPAIPGFYGYHL